MHFRTNLIHLRTINNMTQEHLAMLLGVSRQSVTKWESGKSYPEMDKLLKMCQVFDCTLDDLVQGDLSSKEPEATLAKATFSEPEDIFDYDGHMRRFTSKIANGVMGIILGVALSIIFFAVSEHQNTPQFENVFAALGLLCLFAGIGVGLSLIIPAGIGHSAFVKAHPFIEDFYTPEQKAQARTSFSRQLIGGLCCIFAAICLLVLFSDTSSEETLGIPIFLALVAIGVRFIISGGMTLGRINIGDYNKTAGELMEPSDIENANVSPERKREMLSARKTEKRAGAVCGAIILIATIVGLVMLFVPEYQSDLFWLAWVFGGLLCGVSSVLIRGFSRDDL